MTAKFAPLLAVCALALAVTAAPAAATEPVTSFGVTTSSTAAGGHPDLSASFALEEPGEPEAAESVTVNLPRGRLREPERDPDLRRLRLRPHAVPGQLAGRHGDHPRQLRRRT